MSSTRGLTLTLPTPLAPEQELPLSVDDPAVDTPAVLVDLDIAEENIARMAAYAARSGVALRPHAKTHKSGAMAARQMAAGAVGLCVATVTEAQAMFDCGVPDVTIAYPLVGRSKLWAVRDLLDRGALTLTTDSDAVTDAYAELAREAQRTISVLVEVDTGMHRAGAQPQAVVDRARYVAGKAGLDFAGILTHAGHAHDVPGPRGVAMVARAEAKVMGELRGALKKAGLDPRVVSAGSTLTAPFLNAADGITELRPGTYVYNDLRTLASWSCTPDSIAVTVLTTVVSTDGGRVTIDAGSKTLTTTNDSQYGHGHPIGAPEVAIVKLSEEHGVLAVPDGCNPYAVGDRLRIFPIHVCVWMDLQAEVYGVRAGQIVERIAVEAMRHSL